MIRRVALVVVLLALGGCTRSSRETVGSTAVQSNAAATLGAAVDVRVEPQRLGTSHLAVGVTHTQRSADDWESPRATTQALDTLRAAVTFQNQHIMGWGAANPEPAPGQFDFATLDRRLALIRRSGGTPVITLCCSPDWMKGGAPGTTDWSRINDAPSADHFGDFAQLAATVAQRYPDVRYFQVWNEMKGFYDPKTNRWDAAGYTELYNEVYRAVKAVRPDALLGGPYVKVESFADAASQSDPSAVSGPWGVLDQRPLDVVEYWLAHNVGADFVTVDGTTASRAETLVGDPFDATSKFAAIDAWLRARTSLPIWWAEWPVEPQHTTWSDQQEAAVLSSALEQMATSGASVALLWQPQGLPGACRGCLWTDTAHADGGQPSPFAATLRAFRRAFPPGTPLDRVDVSSPDVSAFASPRTLVLVNHTPVPRPVLFEGRVLVLTPYAVRFVDR